MQESQQKNNTDIVKITEDNIGYKIPNKKCNLKNDKPVRFKKAELKKRVEFILAKEVCQVCEVSHDLDYPHHVEQGSCKDDRYLINICVECHRLIHSVGYDAVAKTREQCKNIAWANNGEYVENKS